MVSMNNVGYASSQRTEIIVKDDVDRCWNLCLPLVLLLYYLYCCDQRRTAGRLRVLLCTGLHFCTCRTLSFFIVPSCQKE